MSEITQLDPLPAIALVGVALVIGSYAVALLRHLTVLSASGHPASAHAIVEPVARARWMWRQQTATTERPDAVTWALAPAAYSGSQPLHSA